MNLVVHLRTMNMPCWLIFGGIRDRVLTMRWSAEVARHLRMHLDVGPGTRIGVVARRRKDIDELREVLPGVIEFRLSEAGTVGGGEGAPIISSGNRRESMGGGPLTVLVPADGTFAGGLSGKGSPAEGTLDVVVAWLVRTHLSPPGRRRLLGEIQRALRTGGTLVVVDHNQPRTWWRWLGNVGWCLLRGVEPCARPVYPVAREMKGAAFERISLRIAFRERVQIVSGIKSPVASDLNWTDAQSDEAVPR